MASTSAAASHDFFAGNLKAEYTTFQHFLQTLEAEQDALVTGKTDLLPELTQKKMEHVGALSRLAEKRNHHLAELGLEPHQKGMETWLKQHEPASEIDTLWNDLLQLAATAKTINQINGGMIGDRLRHNQQALSTLLSASNQLSVYGPDGQTQGFSGGRPLGKV